MDDLLLQIKHCQICATHLTLEPNPVVSASTKSSILIIGQAPGIRVHQTGIAWNDPSGERLRSWLQLSKEEFYSDKIAIVPMGFCYPGKGKSGDLAPRKECAPQWHQKILDKMPDLQLTLLIGSYAQAYYLPNKKKTLTETIRNYKEYLPNYLVLPHPSPRNNIWLKKNSWFEKDVLPLLQKKIAEILAN